MANFKLAIIFFGTLIASILARCYEQCQLALCDGSSSVNILTPADQPVSPAICLEGRALGVASSSDSYKVNPDSSLSRNSIPYAFKTLTISNGSASIAHQYFSQDEVNEFNQKCIVVPLSGYQLLDSNGAVIDNVNDNSNPFSNCVSFIAAISTATTALPSPTLQQVTPLPSASITPSPFATTPLPSISLPPMEEESSAFPTTSNEEETEDSTLFPTPEISFTVMLPTIEPPVSIPPTITPSTSIPPPEITTAVTFPPTETSAGPSPTIDLPPGDEGMVYTDPHVRTFDGLNYDCQASGIFTMFISQSNNVQVQALFSGTSTRGTVTKGIAISENNVTVQLSIAENSTSSSTELNSCPVLLYVNGLSRPLSIGSGLDEIATSFDATTGSVTILTKSFIRIVFRPYSSSTFGCFLESVRTFVPKSIQENGDVIGMLGTPNGNPFDDWTSKIGTPISNAGSSEGNLFETAYDYCTTNWCISEESQTIFTFENGITFDNYNFCDIPYGNSPDFADASEELRELCGSDVACLVDGLVGDIDDARNALNVQAEQEQILSLTAAIQCNPSFIQVGSQVNVKVTVDLSGSISNLNVSSFSLYRINTDSGVIQGAKLLTLLDDGSASSSDEIGGDSIFSNILPLRSESAGEVFSFRVIPVIAGSEDPTSSLVTTGLTTIRSYSVNSNISPESQDRTTVTVNSLSGLDLVARYSWALDNDDLDTSTRFLSDNVGFGCAGTNQYLDFSGDDTSNGGTETIIIKLSEAQENRAWSGSTSVNFYAGWFSSNENAPATLRLFLVNSQTQQEVPGTAMSAVISPFFQAGCASTLVASLDVVSIPGSIKLTLAVS